MSGKDELQELEHENPLKKEIENLLIKYRLQIIVVLVGIFLLGLGFYFVRNGNVQSNQVEILEPKRRKKKLL